MPVSLIAPQNSRLKRKHHIKNTTLNVEPFPAPVRTITGVSSEAAIRTKSSRIDAGF
jgi:hypothetical protein